MDHGYKNIKGSLNEKITLLTVYADGLVGHYFLPAGN